MIRSLYSILEKRVFGRFTCYLIIGFSYLRFMHEHAPLGIKPLDFQVERVNAALHNLYLLPKFVYFGLTSWTAYPAEDNSYYFVQAIQYLHYLPSYMIGGKDLLANYISINDPLVILLCAAFSAELFLALSALKDNLIVFATSQSIFLLMFTSIFSYRMLLSLWHDAYCLLFVLIACLCFSKGRKISGSILLIIGFLFQYHWALLYACFLSTILLLDLAQEKSMARHYFPPCFKESSTHLSLLLITMFSPLIIFLQKILLGINDFKSLNSDALYRVGINSLSNIHHGGILGALQFLGGIRLNLCLNNSFLSLLKSKSSGFGLDEIRAIDYSHIFMFNCLLSVLGMFLLSLVSIIGFYLFLVKNKASIWFIAPVTSALLLTYMVLQQSVAAHLQGRSLLFSIVFSYGLAYMLFLYRGNPCNNIYSSRLIFATPVVFGVAITSIRLSYYLGING